MVVAHSSFAQLENHLHPNRGRDWKGITSYHSTLQRMLRRKGASRIRALSQKAMVLIDDLKPEHRRSVPAGQSVAFSHSSHVCDNVCMLPDIRAKIVSTALRA